MVKSYAYHTLALDEGTQLPALVTFTPRKKKGPTTHLIEDQAGFTAILHILVVRKTLTTLFSPYLIT
jgi:hypothetical protein